MDQVKIGKFIAQMRKKHGLSQRQLADQIDVTDKTVSKWETGYRMPDASILLKLSSALQIDVNELLAGEEIPSDREGRFLSEEYVKKSGRNIVNLVGELNEGDKKRKSGKIGKAAGAVFSGMAFAALLATSLRQGRIVDILDLPTLFYLLGIKFFIMAISGWFHDYLNAWRLCFSWNCLWRFGRHGGKHEEDGEIAGNGAMTANAKIAGNAKTTENGKIAGNAETTANAKIAGNAKTTENGKIAGNAETTANGKIAGNAETTENGKITGNAVDQSLQAIKYAGALSLALGCMVSSMGLFSLLNYGGDLGPAGPSLAQIVLAVFYVAMQETVYIILSFRMKRLR